MSRKVTSSMSHVCERMAYSESLLLQSCAVQALGYLGVTLSRRYGDGQVVFDFFVGCLAEASTDGLKSYWAPPITCV
jgi:hypothetical protein